MKKTMMTAATVAVLAATSIAAPTEAEARRGGAVAAGVIGGLAAGAIIGGAAYPYYGYGYYPSYPAPVYVPEPAYYGPPPGCVLRRQRVWDGYAWRRQNIRVCH
jgi:MFS family permease